MLQRSRSSHPDHNFADVPVGFEIVLRRSNIAQGKSSIDDRPQATVLQRRHHISNKAFGRLGTLRRFA